MKFITVFITILFLTIPSFSEIKEFPSDKVLVDTDLAEVIYIPRDVDYNYHLKKQETKYVHRPSLKEIIFGKKKCSKTCGK